MTKKGTGGLWILLGLVFGILVTINGEVDYNQEGLDCWDICVFEQADDPKNTNALALLYNIINRIRHLRIFDGVSKVWFSVQNLNSPFRKFQIINFCLLEGAKFQFQKFH